MLQQYFDHRTGRQLREDEALENGFLRDGVVQRVRMTARDSRMPTFFDAALHRPGYRGPRSSGTLNDYLARDDRRSVYNDYENSLVNSWRTPVRTDAVEEDLEDDQNEVNATRNEREKTDKRTVAQQMQDHATRMNDIYTAVARDLEQEWRKR
jgi:hypothetical protein